MNKVLKKALLLGGLALTSAFSANAALVQKNVYAYDIRVDNSSEFNPKVSYKLNGTTASVTIKAYADGVEVASVAGTTKETNSVTVPLDGKASGKITFEVIANTKTTVTTPTIIKAGNALSGVTNVTYGYSFSCPMSITVNNAPNSPSFGQIIVAEANGSSSSTVQHSSLKNGGRGNCLYAFDPTFTAVKNSQANAYGFSANLNMVAYVFNQVRFSGDGRLFLATYKSNSANTTGAVYEIPTALNTSAADANGLNSAAKQLFTIPKPTNPTDGNASPGFDVVGSGSGLKLGVVKMSKVADGSGSLVSADFYNLGTKTSWSGNPTKTIAATTNPMKHFIRQLYMNGVWDKDGNGFCVIGRTSSGNTTGTDMSMVHYNLTGTPTANYKDADPTPNQFGGQVYSAQYNHDRTLLALAKTGAKIEIYTVQQGVNGAVPTFTKAYDFTLSGTTTTDVAFDYANNLYIGNRSNEYVTSYQLPASIAGSSTTVPAPESEAYEIVQELTVTEAVAAWDATNVHQQNVTVKWDDANSSDYYNIFIYGGKELAADAEPINETPIAGTASSAVVRLTSSPYTATAQDDVQKKIVIKSYKNGKELSVSQPYPVNHAAYAKPAAPKVTQATDEETGTVDVTLTWTAPTNCSVRANGGYTIWRCPVTVSTDENGKVTNTNGTFVQIGVAPANELTFTDENVRTGNYRYRVRAHMQHSIWTESGLSNYAQSSNSGVIKVNADYTNPEVVEILTYTGRNSINIDWNMTYGGVKPTYYQLYRDGILIMPAGNFQTFVDENVPDGQHEYVAVAIWLDANRNELARRESKPVVSDPVHRELGYEQYGLEEVYNYRIYDYGSAAAQQAGDNCVQTRPGTPYENLRTAVGAWGAPGDCARQAVYQNGKWYLQLLSDRTPYAPGEKNAAGQTNNNWRWIPNSLDQDDYDRKNNGWIVEIDANDPRRPNAEGDDGLAHANKLVRVRPLMTQAIALDEANPNKNQNHLHLFYKGYYNTDVPLGMPKDLNTANKFMEGYLFYTPMDGLSVIRDPHLGFDDRFEADFDLAHLDLLNKGYEINNYGGQHFRTHYLAADGFCSTGTEGSRIFMAMNMEPTVYVQTVSLDNGVASVKENKEFHIPATYEDVNGIKHDFNANTENYALPIPGRKDFIHLLRGSGYFYVNWETGKYTPIYTASTNCSTAGGLVFEFNDELFFINPTSETSNDFGHFRIKMAPRASNDAGIETATFDEYMIPVASFTQKSTGVNFEAGNSNAAWFGVEPSSDGTSIYIYQYVPGIRFAKYRFYPYSEFPPVAPQLDVNIAHNDDDTDITHFQLDWKFERPVDYNWWEGHDYELKEYAVRLYDANYNILEETTIPDLGFEGDHGENPVYSGSYHRDADGNRHIDRQMYTVKVTPKYVYKQDETRIVTGEPAFDTDKNKYVGSIGELTTEAFKDDNNGSYRVDINFDRADLAMYPEPVSYFTIERTYDEGKTWEQIPDLYLHHQGEHKDFTSLGNKVPGTYVFGNENGGAVTAAVNEETGSDKGVIANGKPAVAFYYTQNVDDVTQAQYRATAHYAADNSYIRQSYATPASTRITDVRTTTVTDIETGTEVSYSIYPVPAVNDVTVRADVEIESIVIFSLSGAEVKRVETNGDTTRTFNVSDLPAGNYVVRVNDAANLRLIKK